MLHDESPMRRATVARAPETADLQLCGATRPWGVEILKICYFRNPPTSNMSPRNFCSAICSS